LGVVNDPEAALQESFRSTEGLFSNQHINLVYINDQNEIIYPVEEEARLKIKSQLDNLILTSQWQAVKTGQRLGFTNSKNIFGQSDTTAYVMLSLGLNDKTGVLLLTQPATNVEDSAKSLNMNLFKGFIISSIVAVIISFFYASIQVRRIN